MKDYRFHVYLIFEGKIVDGVFHSVFANSYKQAYRILLDELPHNFPCDSFDVNRKYRVNGRERTANK